MAGAVHVRVVALVRLVLDVRGVDGDSARLLFRSLVDLVVAHRGGLALLGQDHGDGSGQSGLAVVNVADGANVYVRLGAFKLSLRHCKNLPWSSVGRLDAGPTFILLKQAQKFPSALSTVYGAGDGNRTHVTSLGSWHSTIELRPRNHSPPL